MGVVGGLSRKILQDAYFIIGYRIFDKILCHMVQIRRMISYCYHILPYYDMPNYICRFIKGYRTTRHIWNMCHTQTFTS